MAEITSFNVVIDNLTYQKDVIALVAHSSLEFVVVKVTILDFKLSVKLRTAWKGANFFRTFCAARHLILAPGRDGIPYEAYKALVGNTTATGMLLARYNSLLRGDHGLAHIEARSLGIPKPNGKIRPLSLLSSQHKILERLCLNRIPTDKLSATQSGFRRGMSCLRPLLTLVVVIGDSVQSKKFLEIRTHDCEKAFDSVPKEYLAQSLHRHVLATGQASLAKLFGDILLAPIHAYFGEHGFVQETGTPQGGVLSPFAFLTCVDSQAEHLLGTGFRLSHCPAKEVTCVIRR
jgi:hypothetical protein